MHYLKQKYNALLSIYSLFYLIFLLCIFVFFALAEAVWWHTRIAWDAPMALTLHRFAQPWLNPVMQAITETAGPGALLMVAGIGSWRWLKAERIQSFAILATFGGALLFNALLKLFFARPRPLFFSPLVVETDYSFPSGHTVAAVILYGGLAVLLWQQRHYLWATLSATWVVIVGGSRVYLGVHYPSDVLAAFCVGILWLWLAFALYHRVKANNNLYEFSQFLWRRGQSILTSAKK